LELSLFEVFVFRFPYEEKLSLITGTRCVLWIKWLTYRKFVCGIWTSVLLCFLTYTRRDWWFIFFLLIL